MVVPIHLFVKIFKKLMYHTDIRGCKVGILHQILIEFILFNKWKNGLSSWARGTWAF